MNLKYNFAFVREEVKPGVISIDQHFAYDAEKGYGFAEANRPSKYEDLRDSWTGEYFIPRVKTLLIDVLNGNYVVKAALGSENAPTATTVKAGLGRMMLNNIETRAGEIVRDTFAVNVDDGQLKLAFSGSAPGLRSIEIVRELIPTLYMAGDSTMTDQPSGGYPYSGWGQMFAQFFSSGLAVANHARSGRSSKSFIDENRLDRIWKRIRPSDIVLVQFAHNDEKDNAGGTQPFTTFKDYLKMYIEGARQRGAYPILVSAMHRRFFDDQGLIKDTHGDYITAVEQLAGETETPYIDLAARSKRYYEQLGEEETKTIFVWARPNQYEHLPEGAEDNTHFTEKGGNGIARLVAEGIREANIEPLNRYLRAPRINTADMRHYF